MHARADAVTVAAGRFASRDRPVTRRFRAAVREIKTFADDLEEQGGTILGSVDGVDVTVDHVKAMDENMLLTLDYGTALEKFRRVSKLKQTLERMPPVKRGTKGKSAAPAKAVVKTTSNVVLARPVITTKSVIAGAYDPPPAEAPQITEICGTSPDSETCSRKMRP